jgi:hypothetical protein
MRAPSGMSERASVRPVTAARSSWSMESSQRAHHHALQQPCGHSQPWYRAQQCEPLPPEQP